MRCVNNALPERWNLVVDADNALPERWNPVVDADNALPASMNPVVDADNALPASMNPVVDADNALLERWNPVVDAGKAWSNLGSFPYFLKTVGDAHGTAVLNIRKVACLAGAGGEALAHVQFGLDGPAGAFQLRHPHLADDSVAQAHRQAVVNFRARQNRRDAIGHHLLDGIVGGEQQGAHIFQPADVNRVVDDGGIVYVVGFNGDGQGDEKRPFAHKKPSKWQSGKVAGWQGEALLWYLTFYQTNSLVEVL
jgi:hypothetical protein